jgi:5'-deoxynucleotidase YfbR-like HD superfamily hydrolase
MPTVSEIYEEYKIMPSLRMHMLRVAAVASMICDNFSEPLAKETIIPACLFHDMGNILKSDLKKFPQFVEPEGEEYWQSVKNEYLKKYGEDEVEASAQIMRKIGLSPRTVEIAEQNQFSRLCEHMEGGDMEVKIVHYADGRVNPHGVVDYMERMEEARVRYFEQNKGWEEERQKLVACGAEIEKQIFAKCKIKPEDITDEAVAPIIEELKSFVIK